MNSEPYKIYGGALSPYTLKICFTLDHKEIPYELVFTMPYDKRPEFRNASPSGFIPVLIKGDWGIADSTAIVSYLERVHPTSALYPEDPKLYAETMFVEDYADTFFVDNLHGFFMNRVAGPMLKKREPDLNKDIEKVREGMPWTLKYITERIQKNDGYLVGGHLTIADLMTGALIWDLPLGHEPLDRKAWPVVAEYFDRLMTLPYFQKYKPIRAHYWMGYMERGLAKRDFMINNTISIWDVKLVKTTLDYIFLQHEIDMEQYPIAGAYIDRVTNHPLFNQKQGLIKNSDSLFMG